VAMFMTQVVLQGFYSFSSRRNAWYVPAVVIPTLLLRLVLFVVMFYILFGFMFSFIFFWVAMYYCDNPYAFEWYKFGAYYMYYFFKHIESVFRLGFSRWNGQMDMDALVGAHTIYAFFTDLIFGLVYVVLNRQQDPIGKYFDLTFFDLWENVVETIEEGDLCERCLVVHFSFDFFLAIFVVIWWLVSLFFFWEEGRKKKQKTKSQSDYRCQ